MPDSLQAIIQRLLAGTCDETDIQAIAAAIASGKLVLASAPGSVSIGGDVSGSQIVTGNSNVTGDRNIVIYGADAQAIQSVLAMAQEQQANPERSSETIDVSTGQRRRLEERWNALQSEWQLRSEKAKRLREALAIEASTAVQFQLEKQLLDEEAQLTRLSKELDRLESSLQKPNPAQNLVPSPSSGTMTIPEPFTAIPVTAGILTNIASDILKYHAQALDGTLAGQALKWAGLIEPNLYDRLQEVLFKALDLYFNTYPERDLLGIDNFFLDAGVAQQVGGYILERQAINWTKVQQAFDQKVTIYPSSKQRIQYQGLRGCLKSSKENQ